jgi:predicted transcriptional regulator
VAGKQKFNRIPKTEVLIPQLREAGVGLHVLPTYLCLLDHTDTRGRCWPSINRMARILGLCRRTVERHMRQLCEAGLVLRNDQQRARGGRFSTSNPRSIYKGTKDSLNSEKSQIDYKDQEARRRAQERKRRWEGYEWLLG